MQNKVKTIKSPLRYPGGKSKAGVMIADIIGKELKPRELVVSPFCGGGSVELELASRGISVFAFDKFYPVMNFWNVLKTRKEELVAEIEKFSDKRNFSITGHRFKLYKEEMREAEDPLREAVLFYVLNRCGYSGLLSGGAQSGCPRWTAEHIEKLSAFEMPPSIAFGYSDFRNVIVNYCDSFFYCDPPYLIENGNYYGYDGELHKNFDHEALAYMLKPCGR